jgi:hypothetical protein
MRAPAPTADPQVRAFVEELAAFGDAAPPEPRPALVARLDGFVPLHAVPDPLASPPAHAARARRRGMRAIAAACVGGAVVFGGLATAGALPDPLQRATAEVGARIGIDLPGPDRAAPSPPASRRDPAGPAGEGTAEAPDARTTRPGAGDVPPAVPAVPELRGAETVPLPRTLPQLPDPTATSAPAPAEESPASRVTREQIQQIVRELSGLLPPP